MRQHVRRLPCKQSFGYVGPRRFPSCALRLTPCGRAFPLSNAAHVLFYQGALWSLAEKCGSPQRSRLPNMARNLRLLRNLEGTASDEGGGPALGEIPGGTGYRIRAKALGRMKTIPGACPLSGVILVKWMTSLIQYLTTEGRCTPLLGAIV